MEVRAPELHKRYYRVPYEVGRGEEPKAKKSSATSISACFLNHKISNY